MLWNKDRFYFCTTKTIFFEIVNSLLSCSNRHIIPRKIPCHKCIMHKSCFNCFFFTFPTYFYDQWAHKLARLCCAMCVVHLWPGLFLPSVAIRIRSGHREIYFFYSWMLIFACGLFLFRWMYRPLFTLVVIWWLWHCFWAENCFSKVKPRELGVFQSSVSWREKLETQTRG